MRWTLLALLLLAPTVHAEALYWTQIQPRAVPLEAEAEAPVVGEAALVVPLPAVAPAVPARAPDRSVPPAGVQPADASDAPAWAEVEEGTLADPSTWAAEGGVATVPVAESRRPELTRVSLRFRSDGDALVPIPPSRLDRAESRFAYERAPRDAPALLAAPAPAARPLAAVWAPGPAASWGEAVPVERAEDAPRAAAMHAQAAAAPAPAWHRAAALAAGAAILLLLPFALYHRLRGARALENERRARIAELLRATPGLAAADAARILGIDSSTARYHLARMASEGLAVAHGSPRRPRYFAPGDMPASARDEVVAIAGSEAVLDRIRATPGLSVEQLARAMGIGRSTLRWHLGKLARAGRVRLERCGREVHVRPEAF